MRLCEGAERELKLPEGVTVEDGGPSCPICLEKGPYACEEEELKLYTIYYYFSRFALESTMIWANSEGEALELYKGPLPQYIKVDGRCKEIGTVRI